MKFNNFYCVVRLSWYIGPAAWWTMNSIFAYDMTLLVSSRYGERGSAIDTDRGGGRANIWSCCVHGWHCLGVSGSIPKCWHGSSADHPANTRHWAIVGSMLVHRLRRWPNIEPTMAKCLVFAGQVGPAIFHVKHYTAHSMNKPCALLTSTTCQEK